MTIIKTKQKKTNKITELLKNSTNEKANRKQNGKH